MAGLSSLLNLFPNSLSGSAAALSDLATDTAVAPSKSIWSSIGDSLIDNSGDILAGLGTGGLTAAGAVGAANVSGKNALEQLRLQGQLAAELQKEQLAARLKELRAQEQLAREAQLQQAFQNIVSTTLAGGNQQASGLTNIAQLGQNAALR